MTRSDDTLPAQIALPLMPVRAGEAQRIVVGNANAHVVEALQNPERWPFHTAVLTGPPRSGKSLLGRWIAGQGGAGRSGAGRSGANTRVMVIDGADARDEAYIFHRWNAVQEGAGREGERLLLVADSLPWTIALPDLRSRLGGSLQLAIGEPDDAMAADLIAAHAQQRALSLSPGAADYLVPRARRSFAAIEALVAAIDRISLERSAPATMSVWRAALEAVEGPAQKRLV